MPVEMKRVIAEAFMELVQKKGIDKVTVKALIEQCHISRQTFYYHFQDIMDVLEFTIRQSVRHLVEESLRTGNLHAALRIFIAFSVERSAMIRKLLDSQRRAQIEDILLQGVMDYLRMLSRHAPQEISLTSGEEEVLLRYNACGLVGILLTFGGDDNLDQEKLASQLERIVSGEISGWLGK